MGRAPSLSLLLDTHIWIWTLLEPERLRPDVRRALETAEETWLSPVSVWEALVLGERGRLQLLPTPAEWVREALRRAPLKEAPLTHDIAIESRSLRLTHQDPADRFIVATAKVLGLTLVTADRSLVHSKHVHVLANKKS